MIPKGRFLTVTLRLSCSVFVQCHCDGGDGRVDQAARVKSCFSGLNSILNASKQQSETGICIFSESAVQTRNDQTYPHKIQCRGQYLEAGISLLQQFSDDANFFSRYIE
jgi:hypothetical protein